LILHPRNQKKVRFPCVHVKKLMKIQIHHISIVNSLITEKQHYRLMFIGPSSRLSFLPMAGFHLFQWQLYLQYLFSNKDVAESCFSHPHHRTNKLSFFLRRNILKRGLRILKEVTLKKRCCLAGQTERTRCCLSSDCGQHWGSPTGLLGRAWSRPASKGGRAWACLKIPAGQHRACAQSPVGQHHARSQFLADGRKMYLARRYFFSRITCLRPLPLERMGREGEVCEENEDDNNTVKKYERSRNYCGESEIKLLRSNPGVEAGVCDTVGDGDEVDEVLSKDKEIIVSPYFKKSKLGEYTGIVSEEKSSCEYAGIMSENVGEYAGIMSENVAEHAGIMSDNVKRDLFSHFTYRGYQKMECKKEEEGINIMMEKSRYGRNVKREDTENLVIVSPYFSKVRVKDFKIKPKKKVKKVQARIVSPYFCSSTQQSVNRTPLLTAAQKKHQAYERKTPYHNWVPPRSPFSLLQEDHFFDPWRVLVICMLLNRTTGLQARKVLSDFFHLCPNAKTAVKVPTEDIEEVTRSLGLYKKRALGIQQFSHEYLNESWTHVTELTGVG
ncbi:DNA glycosylase superfamily protein, partial [Striga hermonthica]